MDTTLSPPAGQLLDGRYLVESRLAQGGMATVYLGRDTRLDRIVALKVAHPELAGDREFVRRFGTEARAVAQLSSPHVVAVYDQGSAGDLQYIAMEYVAGPTLREVLNVRGALSAREALDVIEGVLAGLAAAHRAGIIHRDVKPENVLLGTDGAVKVADFGLARAAAAVGRTKSGMIIGTAAYLAPEQVSSSTSDARTDVYAAGIMLFEMLTGAQPHTGESPLAVAYKHVTDIVPPPSTLVAGLPPALDGLVALATSRDPELRPADAGQFLHAITEVRQGAPVPSAVPPSAVLPSAHVLAPEGAFAADPLADTDLRGMIPVFDGSAGPGGPGGPGGGAPPALPGAADLGAGAATSVSAVAIPVAGPDWRRDGHGAGSRLKSRWPDDQPDATGDLLPLSLIQPPAEENASYRPANHTLVVPAGNIVPGFHDGPQEHPGRRLHGYQPDHEPLLQRLLYSRRVIYIAAGLAVVLITVLLVWWLSAGQYTRVPQVGGWTTGLARTELTGLGFKVRQGTGRHSDEPRGHVIGISPRPGAQAKSGATITLTPSLGPVKIPVPAVTGLPLQQAQQALRTAGLTPGDPQQATSTTIAAGVVISTNPVAGTPWPKNKQVGMTVSAGPPLPNFVGGPLTSAQSAASAGGYQINPVQDATSNQPAGTVTGQSPKAGSAVHPGEVVVVHVSPGPPQVSVPNVQGMPAHQAENELTQAGFQVTVHKQGPGERVFSYSPQGQATAGSTITINVGFPLF
jgi:beta-lactam-binding protein with PASTA domain/predicted Ser/Thr protein kinase